ncbi:acyl-CoA dehydrogenase [Desulfosporosinus sp. BICA1-9]|uniref:acyl-CoA dehydrogenase n=1 Tax=Desulfosporosinus sp. BICA1-9 TaxID=1531958 RepID=UPI00054BF86C|nr:acyl-CoA dehydrogenase [Desulfosporosinus sp. BICA1-9]KJS50093.1 MAG: acyl-CoA dehydrogenase [Peptococcaceae bacterium BRH_c23]KJS89834.1 MAG: acyl-CoA dehydrogenase [Desulfosporosinus sp. BICA1-9]HBW36511.1 acyl-CoA dehydrogenase [Desulfosporosinus sp.]
MIFDLTQDHIMMRKMVRDFAEKECAPGAEERDETEEFSVEIWKKCGELGLAGVTFPEEYGGVGADYISYAITVEELSRVDASVGVTISAHASLCANPIAMFGTEEQKLKYLTPLATGAKLGAFGLTEPMAGSDASGTRTTAVRDGNDYVLNGSKIFITNANYADVYVVTAQMDKSKGNKGIAAFILEKGMPGFSFGKKEKKMGIRSSATYELVFEDVRVPAENLLGAEGQGFKIAMQTLDYGRIGIASQALGIAQGAYEQALKYTKAREQFGKPISAFQNTQFKLADMATQIEAARLLVYQSAYLASEHRPVGKASAMAKLFASETAMAVTTMAVQLHGGYGYTREYPVERMMRDAKITEIYEGTSEIQRIVISSHILKD